MNTVKKYTDSDGNDCTLHEMIKREPQWAANRIQAGEYALETLELIKAWDINQYIQNGKFTLPLDLRGRTGTATDQVQQP